MQSFFEGYVACALWSSCDDNDTPLDQNYDESDIARETLESMRADCTAFEADNEADLKHAGNDGQNGHDFWLTRNRHGSGFWDRGYKNDVGERLTNAAHAYGESDMYLGDDGKIYVS